MMKYSVCLFLILGACAHPQKTHDLALSKTAISKSGYAPINGLKMYYEIHGQGEPLVLIHGGGSTIESNYAHLIPLLSKNRQVIAMEEQGHGHTAAIDRPFTFENSADDVAALLDYLKVEKADVFGFSNGGNIAMQVAIRHPKKVRKLMVASAMYQREGMVKGFWDGMKNATLEAMPKVLQDADRKINPDPKHLQQLFDQDSKRMREFKDVSVRDIKSVGVPTLVLVGDQDVVTVDHTVKLSRLFPKGRLAVLPANHGSYLGDVAASSGHNQMPELTAILINEFLLSAN